ncbi:hypothetical protein JCM10212_002660 [Sporobolomyces blumeae]
MSTPSNNSEPETSSYGYIPSLSYGVIFIAVFAITMVAHVAQIVLTRRKLFMIVMPLGCLGELLGWSMRLASRWHPDLQDTYIGQLALLVISPTFFSAALYWCLGLVIGKVAPSKSPVPAKWFKISFVVADIVSLLVQAVGGGIAGSAVLQSDLDLGSNIMLGGIVFQLVVMIIYVAYGAYWIWRARDELGVASRMIRLLLWAMAFASACIIARGIFRTAELAEGFDGYLATEERMILVDAIPIALASISLNIIHPAWYLHVDETLPSSSPSRSQDTLGYPMTSTAASKSYEHI